MLNKIITKIEVQKRNENRVNIYLDGEYYLACSTELVYSHKLKINSSINIEELSKIIDEDNYLKCKSDALRILEKTYKSEKEMQGKLFKKGYDEKSIKKALGFLKEYGFLDDIRYAQMYITDKIKLQGRNKIKYALIRKGISEDIICEKLSNISNELEYNTALKLAEKKYKVLVKSEKDSRKLYKKTGEFLVRNGFDTDTVSEILSKVIKKEEIEEECQTEIDLDEMYELAKKRLNIISKSESDSRKLYKKLGDYLLRRGYPWEEVKKTLKSILNNQEDI